jgi:hypothetical protein
VGADRSKGFFRVAVGIQVIHFKDGIMTVIQRAGRNAFSAQLERQIDGSLEVVYHFGALKQGFGK